MASRFEKCQSILDLRFRIQRGSIRRAVVDLLSRASPSRTAHHRDARHMAMIAEGNSATFRKGWGNILARVIDFIYCASGGNLCHSVRVVEPQWRVDSAPSAA